MTPVSPIESIARFREVPLKMFSGDSTVRPSQDRLDIRDKLVRPRKQMTSHFGVQENNTLVLNVLILCHFPIGFPAIRSNLLDQRLFILLVDPQPIQHATDYFCSSIRHDLSMSKTGFLYPILSRINRYCNQNGSLPLTSTDSLAFTRLGTKERLVYFNEASQAILGVPLLHGFPYLMRHYPNGLVISDPQFSTHLCYGNAGFGGRHPVDKPKPLSQRNLCPMENSSRCYRYLVAAGFTLIQTSAARLVITIMVAAWTVKAIRPTDLKQVFQTLLLGIELVLKLQQRHFLINHLLPPPVIICRIT